MKCYKSIFLVIIALFCINGQGNSQKTTFPNIIDVLNYSFSIKISDNSDSIYGEAIITIKALEDYSVFSLDLENKKQNGKGMSVIAVMKPGKKLEFSHSRNILEIHETDPVKKGDTSTYKILYSGTPSDGLIISRNKFGKRTFFSDNWPERARCWIPCNDLPADKATVSFNITAPSHYQVISNGRLVNKLKAANEQTQWFWREEIPISTKVMVFGAADFAIKSDTCCGRLPVETWVYEDNKSQGFHDYFPAKAIVDSFERIIGKFPYEKLANVQSTTIYGGMENASCIFYAESSVTGGGRDESLLAHEIAHQWFGNSVTEHDWAHLWLSEGFATFFANIYFERQYGKDSLYSRLLKERNEAIAWPGNLNTPVIPDRKINPRFQLNPVTYEKAGWFLNMLRAEIGDRLFFKGIRTYYSNYVNKTANTEDFRAVMEQSSGKDLKEFFKQWLNNPGYPDIQITWHYNADKQNIEISVEQKQKIMYNLSLEISVNNSRELISLKIKDKNELFIIPFEHAPISIKIDPELKLFAKFSLTGN